MGWVCVWSRYVVEWVWGRCDGCVVLVGGWGKVLGVWIECVLGVWVGVGGWLGVEVGVIAGCV
jgi:hypothetical protein